MSRPSRRRLAALTTVAAGLAVGVAAAPALGATTERVSVTSSEQQGSGDVTDVALNDDARYVAFATDARLAPGDANDAEDVYLRDRAAGTTTLVSRPTTADPDGGGRLGEISATGRFVTWASKEDEPTQGADAYVYDRATGASERVGILPSRFLLHGRMYPGGVSADGRYVAFGADVSRASPDDFFGPSQAFLRDRTADTTAHVSTFGIASDNYNYTGPISDDARFAVYSWADIAHPPTGSSIKDMVSGQVEEAVPGSFDHPFADIAAISGDARYILFSDEIGYEREGATYLRDRRTGSVTLVSRRGAGPGGLSDDGRFVSFHSDVASLLPGDTNGRGDAFVRDLYTGTIERVSVSATGAQGNGDSSAGPMSADGRYVAFISSASNLVPGDTNGDSDVFIRDRGPAAPACTPRTAVWVSAATTTDLRLCNPDKKVVAKIRVSRNRISGDMNPWGPRIPLVVTVGTKKATVTPTAAGYWFSAPRPAGTTVKVTIARG